MKKLVRKWLSMLLAVTMLFGAFTVLPNTITADAASIDNAAFQNKINSLKQRYKDGKYWNAYNSCKYEGTGDNPCPTCHQKKQNYCSSDCPDSCGSFYYGNTWISGQCMGFACKMWNEIFGTNPYSAGSKHTNASNLKAGDIVYGNLSNIISGASYHAIFITAISGNVVTFSDCNSTGPCRVKWDRTTSIAAIQTAMNNSSRNGLFGYITHASNSSVTTGTSSTETPLIVYSNISAGTYYLKNLSTGKYLSVDGAADNNTQNISVAAFTAGSEQKLAITSASTGYRFRPLCSSSRLVNPYADSVISGKNVNLYNDMNDSSQWWRFQAVSGGYAVRNVQNSSCVLTVDGTNIIISTYTGASNQIWTLEEVSYTVFYNANGGTGVPSAQTKSHGVNLTLSSVKATRTGHTFTGWNTNASGTGTAYAPGAVYSANEAVTLYAQWEIDSTFTISYDANGGANAPDPQILRKESSDWTEELFTDKEIAEQKNQCRSSVKETKTSNTAIADSSWTLYDTTKSYSNWSDWSNNAVSSNSTREVETKTVPATYKTVWKYNRWTSTTTNYSSYASGYWPDYREITLDYQLSRKPEYDANGHEAYGFYQESGYPSKLWWNETSEKVVNTPAYNQYRYRNITYTYHYYKWSEWSAFGDTPISANENTKVETRLVYKYKTAVNLSSDIPTRKGYTFLGWSENKYATKADYSAGGNYEINDNITLCAVWNPVTITRLAGSNRYDTAIAISKQGWETADTVILANSLNYADALAGVPLAYKLNAPILLTAGKTSLESAVSFQIENLGAKKIVIIGGNNSVSQQIETTLAEKYEVERIQGNSRYETAVAISKKVNFTPSKAIIVTGTGYADALSISPYAAMKGYPIVYSNPAFGLTNETVDYLASAKDIIIVGGTNSVRENTVKQLDGKNIDRIAGDTRYLTSYAIAEKFSSEFGSDVTLATGTSFPDALAGGVLAAKLKTPLLLTNKVAVIDEIKSFILDKTPSNIYVLGGENSVPTNVIEKIYA